jgi:hypothetical protein
MPQAQQTYEITAPNGKVLSITGDRVPNETELHDIFAKAGVETGGSAPPPQTPTFRIGNETDAQGHAVVDPNTIGTFLKHWARQVNPVGIGQLLPFPQSLGGAGWDAPIKAGREFASEAHAVKAKGDAAWAKGEHVEAIRHYAYWLGSVLSLGSSLTLDKATDAMMSGHYAAGLGDSLGVATNAVGPDAIKLARESPLAARLATRSAASADAKFGDVMSPKGLSKEIQRTAKQAEHVATEVRRGTTAITPPGLQAQIGQRLSEASDALDAAYNAVPPKVAYSTSPVLQRLQAAYDRLKVTGTGGSIIPAADANRAAAIQQAITEVRKLGPYTNTQNFAKLRNSWKDLAKDAFTPSLNPNFQQIRGASKGWADSWSAVQEALVERHPELRPLNADYHVWKQASDVMEALADQQRAKPVVGRTIMARAGGAAAGAAIGGGPGLLVGEIVGPLVERGLTNNLGPARKLLVARKLGELSDAIRAGQPTKVEMTLRTLRPMLLTSVSLPQAPAPVWPAAAQGPPSPTADQTAQRR